jgi:energy-coupling factor transporter ATP-binding protein EcfA2
MNDPNKITYFAETDARNKKVQFGIKAVDRTKHVYVIGKTGMGKSTLLENMAVQDIQQGNGFAFLDPHGGSAELLLSYIPEERRKDVLYFAPFDAENPIGFNILEDVGAEKRHLVVSGIMSVFKKIWPDAWSGRMEYFLNNTLFALLEYPGATLLHVNKMLSDKKFRNEVITHVTDPAVRAFWIDEFGNMTDRFIAESVPAIQNKIGQFTTNPVIRNLIGQAKSTFDLKELMDNGKIIIVNLSKGRIGEQNAQLIGSMLVTKIYLAAMSRAELKREEIEDLPNFYLYVDEFQSFSNDSFADILSEARKYKLNLTIAHQYVEQMEETVQHAVFGNVGTTISFRVGAQDAEVLEKEFAPVFEAEDLVNLGKYQIYLKLMIDGEGSRPFSASTIPALMKPEIDLSDEVIAVSRDNYSRDKKEVENETKKALEINDKKGGGDNKGGGNKNNNKPNPNYKGKNPNNGVPKSTDFKNNNNSGNKPVPKSVDYKHEQKKDFNKPVENKESREQKKESIKENPFKKAFKEEDFSNSLVSKAKEKGVEEKVYKKNNTASLGSLNKKKNKEDNRNALKDALSAVTSLKKEEIETKNNEPKKDVGVSDDKLRDVLRIKPEDLLS